MLRFHGFTEASANIYRSQSIWGNIPKDFTPRGIIGLHVGGGSSVFVHTTTTTTTTTCAFCCFQFAFGVCFVITAPFMLAVFSPCLCCATKGFRNHTESSIRTYEPIVPSDPRLGLRENCNHLQLILLIPFQDS